MTKGSDLLVAALENEGVTRIFGVPGEENLDVVESLRTSKIELVVTRHEQTAAFLAATYGRLTGKPGVCIATLGPGALNLVTGAAYAHLGAMPMVMITGQKGIMSSRQARFQIVDMIATMRPLTKSTRQIVSTATIPTLVREAFRVAMEERPGPVHLELPEDIAGEEGPDVPLVPPHAIDLPVAPAGRARPRRGDDPRGEAPARDARRRRQPAAARRRAQRLHPPAAAAVLHHPDGQGLGRRRLQPLHGHRRALGARLCARGDRPRRPDPRDRPRHHREAAVHHGAGRAEGDPCRLHARLGRAGLLSRRRGGRRRRPEPGAARRSPRGPAAAGVAALAAPAGDPRPDHRPQRRGALPADPAADRARRPQGDAGGRHRRARQRHVQDLVRSQLPHPRRQHAPARQRAGDDGRGPAVGDDGGDALSGAPGAGGLRRRRLHDEQPGAGDRGPAEAEPRRADPRGQRLRHDPLEAGGRQLRRLGPDLRQPRLRQVRRGLRRHAAPASRRPTT